LDLDGIACHYPIVLDRVLYALVALAAALLTIKGLFILQYQLERKRDGNKRKSWEPFDLIIITIGIALPSWIASAILRQFQNFGVDAEVSYLWFFSLSLNWIAGNLIQIRVFEAIFRGSFMEGGSKVVKAAIEFNRRSVFGATTLYICALLLVNVIAVYTPGGITPFRIACVAIRNLAGSAYYLYHYFHSKKMLFKLNEILAYLSDSEKTGATKTGAHASLVRAIEHIRVTVRASMTLLAVTMPVLVIFTIVPQLYGYNQVPHAILLILANGPSHVSFVFRFRVVQSTNQFHPYRLRLSLYVRLFSIAY
jgi:hypothetical protein